MIGMEQEAKAPGSDDSHGKPPVNEELNVPPHWGEVQTIKIKSTEDFWGLIDELHDEEEYNQNGKGFYCNRERILDAYVQGNLYGLRVKETVEMYERGSRLEEIILMGKYLLPTLCVVDGDEAIIIWVDERARRCGFASKLIKDLKITRISKMLKGSEEFWSYHGIQETPRNRVRS